MRSRGVESYHRFQCAVLVSSSSSAPSPLLSVLVPLQAILSRDNCLKCKSQLVTPWSEPSSGNPHPLEGLRPTWPWPWPTLIYPKSRAIYLFPHAGYIPSALAQNALPHIFWLALSSDYGLISDYYLLSAAFTDYSQNHVTPFSFIQDVCHSCFCLLDFLSFCPKSPRLTWAGNASVLFITVSPILTQSTC